MENQSRVLVVDDDAQLCSFLRRALTRDWRILTAGSVAEAEPILAREEIKVIICDDNMPGETGLMFLSRIRAQYPHTRRILLTGNDQQASLVFAINEVHVFHYLIKPVAIEDLRRLVNDGVTLYDQSLGAAEAADEGARLRRTVAKHLQRHDPEPETRSAHERGVWLRLLGWGSTVAALVFALGVFTLVALYFLKSWLGIDIFQNHHVQDLW